MPVDHLTAIPIICDHFRNRLDLSKSVVVATDAGGAKRAGRFAKKLDTSMAIIDKRRLSDTDVIQRLVVGDVKGRDAIIFDDEISTGGTLITTVKTLEKADARNIYVGVTHPVLCGPAVKNLRDTPIEEIVVTNTIEIPDEKMMNKIKVLSVARLFADAIRRIHIGESVGALFK
jgi:ribose-phosphate pyrophosphokinase